MTRILAMAAAFAFVALLTLAVQACSISGPDDMGKVEKTIRARFPNVTQMSTDELEQKLETSEEPVLLDARKPEEYEVSHLPGARLATPDLEGALQALEGVDKSRPVVVYCSVGYRSSSLAAKLADEGYENVANLEGSIFAWAAEGKPIVKPDGSPAETVHPYDDTWGKLLPEELRATVD